MLLLNTKDLFEDAHQLMDGDHDDVHDLAVDVDFTISAINTTN
jgi:trigger factor